MSALRPSVLWFFQRIAPRVGADRMRDWQAGGEVDALAGARAAVRALTQRGILEDTTGAAAF